jgi:hypothetical protein
MDISAIDRNDHKLTHEKRYTIKCVPAKLGSGWTTVWFTIAQDADTYKVPFHIVHTIVQ